MGKFSIVIFLIMIIQSCLFDPARGVLTINNKTKTNYYLIYAQIDQVSINKVKNISLKKEIENYNFDENDKFHHHLPVNSKYLLPGFGTPSNPKLLKDKIIILFIKDKVIESYPIFRIIENSLYDQVLILNENQLDSMKWEINIK
jgi:hypothetical protein